MVGQTSSEITKRFSGDHQSSSHSVTYSASVGLSSWWPFELSLPGEWEINPAHMHVLASDFEVRVTLESRLELLDPDNDITPIRAHSL